MPATPPIPSSVLIIGSGVFGLSTAYALATKPKYKDTVITLVDRSSFPSRDSSSIDTSRIIRPDYADPAYAALADKAQELWRSSEWGADGRYTETGLCVTAGAGGTNYGIKSLKNVLDMEAKKLSPNAKVTRKESRGFGRPLIEVLENETDLRRVLGTGGINGVQGYVNWSSGWGDAEACMHYLNQKVASTQRVRCVRATVSRLDIDHSASPKKVRGALLDDGRCLSADFTILATGAWTPALLDLRGIARSVAQTVGYITISDSETRALEKMPTALNLETGLFVISPSANHIKLARHGHGYTNPTRIPHPELPLEEAYQNPITVSIPRTHLTDPPLPEHLPAEATAALRSLCTSLYPPGAAPHDKSFSPLPIAERPFAGTRMCYYTDRPHCDFLIDYHPEYDGSLFVATAGGGHGFKFMPVIGDIIVQCIEGQTPAEFKQKWHWPERRVPEEEWDLDGSRGGPQGMILEEEYKKVGKAKL
ncbi:FAD dependent oxidoreductase [Phyllosticta citrichinensis]|uniref:FAD dependent oxidoreductase n=1 Tax=Phyllosticta citrichinensis TaxID=1130410 RepID=A0ABR1XZ92_9PEZI